MKLRRIAIGSGRMSEIVWIYPSIPRHTWRVALACGHSFHVTSADLQAQQLFAGKQVACTECAGTATAT